LLFAHPGRKATFDFLQELVAAGFKEHQAIVPVKVDNNLLSDYRINIHHLYR
jgi:hypothetical protein